MRLESLLTTIEIIVKENPILCEMNSISVAKLAVKRAKILDERLWSQGEGQVEKYLTILCSEEPYKSRYDEIFYKSA